MLSLVTALLLTTCHVNSLCASAADCCYGAPCTDGLCCVPHLGICHVNGNRDPSICCSGSCNASDQCNDFGACTTGLPTGKPDYHAGCKNPCRVAGGGGAEICPGGCDALQGDGGVSSLRVCAYGAASYSVGDNSLETVFGDCAVGYNYTNPNNNNTYCCVDVDRNLFPAFPAHPNCAILAGPILACAYAGTVVGGDSPFKDQTYCCSGLAEVTTIGGINFNICKRPAWSPCYLTLPDPSDGDDVNWTDWTWRTADGTSDFCQKGYSCSSADGVCEPN
jgi:hypothetical protein